MFHNPLAITVGELLNHNKSEQQKAWDKATDSLVQYELYHQVLDKALAWSKTKPSSASKGAAQAYIEAMPMAEYEGENFYDSAAKGRAVQILYILNNLQGWRGKEAREAKVILKKQYEQDK